MKPFLRMTAAASALALTAPAAWSMTADEAWNAWIAMAKASNGNVSSEDTTRSGDTLTLSGVTFSMMLEDALIKNSLGEVTLTENGDGSVTIKIPDNTLVTVDTTAERGQKVEVAISLSAPNMDMKVSDAGGATSFTYSAPAATITLDEFKVDGVAIPANVTGQINGLDSTYSFSADDMQAVTAMFSAKTMDIDFDARSKNGMDGGKGKISVENITSTTTGQSSLMFVSPEELAAVLKAGASMQGNSSIGAVSFDLDIVDSGSKFAVNGTLGGASADVQLSSEQVVYDVKYNELDLTASGNSIPLPKLNFVLDETTFKLTLPMAKSSEPKPYQLALGLKKLAIDDGLWNMVDPARVLPRDAATLTFDLTGTGNWLVDVLSPDAMENVDSIPAELHTLVISNVLAEVAGAKLTADGSFTFDNSNLTTFDGFPAPNGTVKAQLVGGNTLLDNLVKMGVMPEAQANGIKLGMGAYARPGNGPDTLTSDITVAPTGAISANGVPLPF